MIKRAFFQWRGMPFSLPPPSESAASRRLHGKITLYVQKAKKRIGKEGKTGKKKTATTGEEQNEFR
jgi:hypothetical protein